MHTQLSPYSLALHCRRCRVSPSSCGTQLIVSPSMHTQPTLFITFTLPCLHCRSS